MADVRRNMGQYSMQDVGLQFKHPIMRNIGRGCFLKMEWQDNSEGNSLLRSSLKLAGIVDSVDRLTLDEVLSKCNENNSFVMQDSRGNEVPVMVTGILYVSDRGRDVVEILKWGKYMHLGRPKSIKVTKTYTPD